MPSNIFNRFSDAADFANQTTRINFMLRRFMDIVRTATVVKVLAVTNAGDVSPVGTVDVQPLVQQTDGIGNVVALAPVYGVPYMRLQGGTDAVILDPKVGDLGIALFSDRDLSAVKTTKDMAPPGSARRFSLSDALYIGGLLNGTPEQYVRFSSEGIELVSPTKVHIQAPNIEADASTQFKVVSPDIQLQGPVHITGAQTNDSTITADEEITSGDIGLQAHHHTAQGATAPTTPSQA